MKRKYFVKDLLIDCAYVIVGYMNITVVVPTIRSLAFLNEWKDQFSDCSLVVVEDHEDKLIETPTKGFKNIHHYSWKDIREDFGKDEWIFPRQNAGIRSYGFWKAYQAGAEVIITLDDDCFPTGEGFVQAHLDNLQSKAPEHWFATFPHPEYMHTRGFPYGVRNKQRVVISHGLWSNKMDMDAKTQLVIGDVNIPAYPPLRQFVPSGYFFPMSSMNLAFTRDVAPLMYFPLMGKDPQENSWGFDRYDDIWAGIFAKKIIDHLGFAVANGSPFVEHRKASDPLKNLEKEKRGMEENEFLWRTVQQQALLAKTPRVCYGELIAKIQFSRTNYFKCLTQATQKWLELFV